MRWYQRAPASERAQLDLEACIRFEHCSYQWFRDTFAKPGKDQPPLAWERVKAWTRYLNPELSEAPQPRKELRPVRRRLQRGQTARKTPLALSRQLLLQLWFRLRNLQSDERPMLCMTDSSGGKHPVDVGRLQEHWQDLATHVAKIAPAAVEDCLRAVYAQPMLGTHFDTVRTLLACGEKHLAKDWVRARDASLDLCNLDSLMTWLCELPVELELPADFRRLAYREAKQLMQRVEALATVPLERFAQLVSLNSFSAKPETIYRAMLTYVAPRGREPECDTDRKQALVSRLLKLGCSSQLRYHLADTLFLSDDEVFSLEQKRCQAPTFQKGAAVRRWQGCPTHRAPAPAYSSRLCRSSLPL